MFIFFYFIFIARLVGAHHHHNESSCSSGADSPRHGNLHGNHSKDLPLDSTNSQGRAQYLSGIKGNSNSHFNKNLLKTLIFLVLRSNLRGVYELFW